MRTKCAGVGLSFLFTVSVALAEPTPVEINNYFNPRPDADVDLDGIVDLQYGSEYTAGRTIFNGALDYDRFAQDIDSQYKLTGNGDLRIVKSDGIELGLGASYSMENYLAPGSGSVDNIGQAFSFVDSGTADPRSFWFASAALGFGYIEDSTEDNPSELGFSVGLGRGRVYSNKSFRQAWALTERLTASGYMTSAATNEQLTSLAKIIDDRIKYSRLANDEGLGLLWLTNIQRGNYTKRLYKEIWQYLSSQGLVSGAGDFDAAFDIKYILEERHFYDWLGGAEVRAGLEFNTSDSAQLDNLDNAFATSFSSLNIPNPTTSSQDSVLSLFASYQQYWALDVSRGMNGGARVAITNDSLLAASANAGYQQEINDYLLFFGDATLAMAIGSDSEVLGLGVNSGLDYQLGPRSSLIATARASTGTDLDFNYEFDLRLAYDLL